MGVSQEVTGDDYILEVSLEGIRAFLNALPEPQDDWEQCTIDQIRKGDRVRWQVPDIEDICIYEIVASHTKRADPGWFLFSDHECYHFPPGAVVDRIPGAQHPDPAQHPVIIVHKTGTVIWDERPAYWNPEEREYVFQGAFCTAFLPGEITEWEPASIVPKVVEDDR